MFDYIKIEGFRSFKKVELEMPRLAVLIGPNGGGKSNFVDLLMLMAEAGRGRFSNGVSKRNGFLNIAFGFDPSQEVRVELRFKEALHPWKVTLDGGDEKLDVRFRVSAQNYGFIARITEELVRQESTKRPSLCADMVSRGPAGAVFRATNEAGEVVAEEHRGVNFAELVISDVKDPVKYPAASVVLKELEGWTFYRDIDVGPESRVRQPSLIREGIQLLPDGTNLSSVLHEIQQKYPDAWDEILEILKTAYPDFLKLSVPAGGGDGNVHLRWFEHPYEKLGLTANLLSDGTLKLLCLIAILKSPNPPPLICIDEPELGLHPDWIELVAELLQDAAVRTQVIVATHSPHIVAKLDPDQVIVTEKENGETRLERLSSSDLEKWLRDFNLADLWLAGHIGGRP
ncbi:MAG TPA: AAA family ATPase [Terriglobia bacterium]|nr:AAA family ATPase [Terriglobia bacterium]